MKLSNLNPLLKAAQKGGYGVGSFSARSTFLIEAILRGAEVKQSPVIVQMSANEFKWFDVTATEFARAFYAVKDQYSIPAALHLDHTKDLSVIAEAIEAGFTSVMIDASHLPFEENAEMSRKVVEMAHPRGISVEAGLGNIGGADKLENGCDTTLFTKPDEAKKFVEQTGVDALAVSIGSAHGVYPVANPAIDFDRLREIRTLVDIPLVLHGGSGLPSETVQRAIALDGMGGVSKINIATDLELCFLSAMGGLSRMSNREINALPQDLLETGSRAVQAVVEDRICHYLHSDHRAE